MSLLLTGKILFPEKLSKAAKIMYPHVVWNFLHITCKIFLFLSLKYSLNTSKFVQHSSGTPIKIFKRLSTKARKTKKFFENFKEGLNKKKG